MSGSSRDVVIHCIFFFSMVNSQNSFLCLLCPVVIILDHIMDIVNEWYVLKTMDSVTFL